jgi:hypothetical protein
MSLIHSEFVTTLGSAPAVVKRGRTTKSGEALLPRLINLAVNSV